MSIVNLNFITTLINAELPALLVLLEETTEDFHVVAKQHAEADTRRQVATRLMTLGSNIEPVIAHAVEDQRLQCLLDQYRERVALVRDVLRERVLSMALTHAHIKNSSSGTPLLIVGGLPPEVIVRHTGVDNG